MRIRELREPNGPWVPAIAETAYFAPDRAPKEFYDAIVPDGRVGSIHELLASNAIEPMTGEYQVRVAPLPESFTGAWARRAGMPRQAVRALRFLRFESTTHGPKGPIEYSVAYLAEGFFPLSTTDLTIVVSRGALRGSGKQLSAG